MARTDFVDDPTGVNPLSRINAAVMNALGDEINRTVADLYENWANNSDGSPSVLESGHPLVSTWNGNPGAALTVSGGKLTNPFTGAGGVAGYLSAAVNGSNPVLYMEGRYQFRNFAANDDGVAVAALLTEGAMPSGNLGSTTLRMPAHLLFTPTYFAYQTFDSGAGNAANVCVIAQTVPSATPKSFAVALDPARNRAVMLCPDGIVRIIEDTVNNRISGIAAPYAVQEILYANADADKRGDWLSFRASTLAGKDDVEYASKWVRLLAAGDALQPVLLDSFANAWSVAQIGVPGYIDRPRFFRKVRYVPMYPGAGTFTVELRDRNTGATFSGTNSGASAGDAKYLEITNGVNGFTFAKGDMPFVEMTATTGAAGIGMTAWLIP